MGCKSSGPGRFEQTDEELEIYPDYTSLIIPPNIAPLNFKILNEAEHYFVELSNGTRRTIRIKNRSGNIQFPMKDWKKMLERGRGSALTLSVYVKIKGGKWKSLSPVQNRIAEESIDPYIAFRKIAPANILWGEMGLYQRSLETFKETPIMVNTLTEQNCMNCHTFNGGDPEQFLFHMRGPFGGTMLSDHGEVQFVDTKTDQTRAAGVYPSWHPDGDLVAFSVNKISQSFHSQIGKLLYVVDKYSDIVLYDVKANSITRPAELATEKLENLPSWSADGTSLYYICTDLTSDSLSYDLRKYSLMSIPFDKDSREFGQADTVISAFDFGNSVTHPRESPDRDYIAFIGLDYGYFSIFNKESNVYLYKRATGEISMPEFNSDNTESYPSWSGNGSWLMFVSKRDDGHFSQVWFSHIDENGQAGKAFVMPQRDPLFYQDYLFNYNRPEFISGKVNLTPRKFFSLAKSSPRASTYNEEGSVSISSGATIPASPEESSGNSEHYMHD